MYYKHHIIPLHEWRRRINPKATRHDKEFNAPDNVVWLTLEQHIQVHQLLWELNRNRFDEIAWQTLSGKIGKEEATILAIKHANTGRKWSERQRNNHSNKMKGRKLKKEHKDKIGKANEKSIRKDTAYRNTTSAKDWIITTPEGTESLIHNLNQFCKDQKLDQGNIMAVVRGKMSHSKGWKCRRQIIGSLSSLLGE